MMFAMRTYAPPCGSGSVAVAGRKIGGKIRASAKSTPRRGAMMMRVTPSAHPLARGRAVVRRATSGEDGAVVETPSPEESAEEKAAAELAAVLESIATEREALIETEMEQKQREMKALESQEDLELVATKQAQLAATAWEEHVEAEEATARRTEMPAPAAHVLSRRRPRRRRSKRGTAFPSTDA